MTVLLLNQLKECITTLVQLVSSKDEYLVENPDVSRLCLIIEKIFNYGLKGLSQKGLNNLCIYID